MHLVKLIESFLSSRCFNVRVENSISTNRPISAGVPQGSCLSPYLYLVYTNDIPVNDNSRLVLFADDTMFYTSNQNPRYAIIALQKQVDIAVSWFTNCRLSINTNKTVAIMFNKKSTINMQQIKMTGVTIAWTNHVNYLGITFDSYLTFNKHVQSTILKARRTKDILYPILNSKSPVPLKMKLQIYLLYIRPLLTYATEAWCPCISHSNWNKIETIQSTSVRISTGFLKFVSNQTLRDSAKIITIREAVKRTQDVFFS